MSPYQELIEAILELLRTPRENKEIKKLCKSIKPLKVKIFERILELLIVGFLVNVASNLFYYNPFIFGIIVLGLGVSLTTMALILWRY